VEALLQFGATLFYSDGTSRDVTSTVIWSSSNPSIATISSTGLGMSLSAGSSTIGVVWGANLLTATTTMTVPSPGQLSVTPASVNFASVAVGSSLSQAGTLTANGGSVTISSAPAVSTPFTVSGITFPITLDFGQSVSFTLTFNPHA